MDIIIIEDERLTAEDLVDVIQRVEPSANIVTVISSVKEGLDFFSEEVKADLIFSDIQLGDGQSFEIFGERQIPIPVIFCTAYDEYALEAFKTNGIDYILKPFSSQIIKQAIEKYGTLKKLFIAGIEEEDGGLEEQNSQDKPKVTSVLVHYRGQILPIALDSIAVFFIRNEITYLKTFKNQAYVVNHTLDFLEERVGTAFYRANRQVLVHRDAIIAVENYEARKLLAKVNVDFETVITISKEKHTPFKAWLEGKQ